MTPDAAANNATPLPVHAGAPLDNSGGRFAGIVSIAADAIVSIAADAIVSVDEEQRIALFNQGAEEIFGYTASDVIGQPLEMLLPHSARAMHRSHVRKFAEGPIAARRMGERREIFGRRKDGREFPAEASISKVEIAGKRFFTAVLRDISDRKAVESTLRRQAALIDLAHSAIMVRDLDERILLWNKRAEARYGWTRDEALGRSLHELLHTRFPQSVIEMRRRLLEAGYWEGELVHTTRNGEAVVVDSRWALQRDDDGKPAAVLEIDIDVTERKRDEEEKARLLARETVARAAAQAAEARATLLAQASGVLDSSLDYRTTLRNLAHLVVPALATFCVVDVIGDDGVVRRLEVEHADPAMATTARALREYPRDPTRPFMTRETLGTGRSLLVPSVDDAGVRALSQDDQHYEIMRALALASYMAVPLIARGQILGAIAFAADASRPRYVPADLALVEELARRVALAVDNAKLYGDAHRASRAREELLGVVSHDLRNPLSAIVMCARALADAPDRGDEVARYAQTINEAAQSMSRMIADLLDVASIEAGRLSIERKPADPVLIVMRALSLFEQAAEEQSITLEADLPERLPRVNADAGRVTQLLSNLIGNAIKFTGAGGRVIVAASATSNGVLVSVTDTGEGIPPEELPYIFDRFWHARRTSSVRGTGLGLAIAKGIAEAHGATLDVESAVGSGSTFRFTLPLSEPLPQRAGDAGD